MASIWRESLPGLRFSARIVVPILVGVGASAAGLTGSPAGAHAATFETVPPKTKTSGSGPLLFSFAPRLDGVAFKLPGGQWQRCQGGLAGVTVQVGPLHDGDYQMLIADD